MLLQNIGEPDWPFGYSHARLVLKHKGKTVTRHKFDVANGGILCPGSWSATWQDDCVEVTVSTVSTEEQRDVFYSLCFDGRTERTQLETKNGK